MVAVLVGAVTGLVERGTPPGSPPPIVTVLSLVLVACGIVMFVMWIGALIKLGQQRAWGWFIGVLLMQLLFLGIVGMAVYAIAGPRDDAEVVIQPTAT